MGLAAVTAGLGIMNAAIGYFGSKKKTPKFDYASANEALDSYMGKSLSLYDSLDTNIEEERVSAVDAGNQAVNFNIQNIGNYQGMASQMNQGAIADRKAMLSEISPQWENQRDIADKSNMAMMKGEVPLDVQQQMARTNAYKSFQAGYSGAPSARQGTLARDLGLTSLGLMQQGQANAQSWLKTTSDIAMPTQVGAGDIMSSMGFNAGMAADVMAGNANRDLDAQRATSENEFRQANAKNQIYGTELETRNALLSQKLADQWGKFSQKQAATQNLVSGIGSSISAGLGMYMGGSTGSLFGGSK